MNKQNTMWIFKLLILTLFLSIIFSIVSELIISNSPIAVAFLIIMILIGISIGFDIIATGAASCNVQTFHAQAARKVRGAKTAVYLAKNASRVTSICGDVIGDICGIMSGAAGSSIVIELTKESGDTIVWSIILSAIIAAATITLKAIAKIYAIKNADTVVLRVGKLLSVFKRNK